MPTLDRIDTLLNLPPVHEIPITWDQSGYTSPAFEREVRSEEFEGWDSALEPDEEAAVMVRLLGARPGQTLLDVACGYGRHALILARDHGLQVTGVDVSPALVERARKGAAREGVPVTYVAAHARDIAWQARFDHAVIAFNSLSVFSPVDVPAILARIRAALNPGGRLFLDLDNKPFHIRYGTCYRNWFATPRALILQDVHFHHETSVEVMRDINIDPDFSRFEEFICFKRIYARDELVALLESAGFGVDLVYGNWDFTRHTESSPKILLVANRR